ncbi:MAG TPA: hypothetical protein VJW23_08130, partial [Propionibacteriaceae bacterium]|nr:hypothetical protein [Propionibacteriaceae bacterium]
IPARWLRIPHLRTLNSHRADDRRRVAHAIEMELPAPLQHGRVAIACIDNADEVRFAVAEAAADLATGGLSVAVVDLTQQGSLDSKLAKFIAGLNARPAVLRPDGIPELATVSDLRAVGHEHEDGTSPSLEQADVVLVLADLDSSVGADYLTTWTDRVIFAVTSGRSSAERLRTAADLAREVGLDLRFAALLRTERTDDSLGGTLRAETVGAETADLDQTFEESQPGVASSEIGQLDPAGDELPHADEHLVAAVTGEDQLMAEEPHIDIEAIFEELQFEEMQFEELQFEDGQAVGEQPTEPRPIADAQLADDEGLGVSDEDAEDEIVATDEDAEDLVASLEDVTASDEDAEDEIVATDEHAEDLVASLEDVTASDEHAEEQPTVEIEATAEEQQAEDEQSDDELTASDEQAEKDEATLEQPSEDERAVDAELIAPELIAPELIASELIGSELIAEAQSAEEEPALHEHAAAEEHPAADDESNAAPEELVKDDGAETELAATADQVVSPSSEYVVGPSSEYGVVEGWYLDTAEAAAVPVGAVATPEDNFDWTWEWTLDDTGTEQPEVTWRPDLETAPQTSPESAPSSDDNEFDPHHQWSLEEPDTIDEVDTIQGFVDGWLLYIDRYPEVYAGTAPTFEGEKLDGNWDWDFDSLTSRHDSVVVDTDGEVDEPSDGSQPTASANGENHQPAPEIHAEEQAQNGAHRPAGNGQGSNGRVGQRARSRNRRRRSRTGRRSG